ncbi:hypothetical protein B0T14DRAFT_500309 [Immersiella caudata]|uniref:Uncharacterized protein n=1 Tax=Immersiella caudata TaxID=314043 RepID=A0AA39TKY3_9PEZI|nr:hypothetical protein B0T14DRAFT_500309 [Immersiella caudata]
MASTIVSLELLAPPPPLAFPIQCIGAMADMVEPSEEEKILYYYGLPSRPRLVARSNFANLWTQEWEDNHLIPKFIGPIGKPDVVQDIRHKYDPDKIIDCLIGIDWTTIDMVRIGTLFNTSDPIILWVGVTPGSLSWQQGVKAARCCRKVLLKAGLDIHCEIRESIVKRTASVIPSQKGNDLSLRSLSAALGGQAIAGERTLTKEGTLGLYLLVDGVKCALVSRHAVSGDDSGSLVSQHVIMPGQKTYQTIYDDTEANLATATTQDGKAAYHKLLTHLNLLREPSSRRIGRIIFSPPRVPVARLGYNSPWLPDYALVALDKERLDKGLCNTIQIDTTIQCRQLMRKYHPNLHLPTGPLQLEGTFLPKDHKVVGKQGRSTGLT